MLVSSPKKPPFAIRLSSIAGRGAFALRTIRKSARIIEYIGERISDEVADERYDDSTMKVHHTFLFAVSKNVNIDAAVGGNDSRFINHSCDPNCEAIDDGGRIFIYAVKSIQAGTELTYDYRYQRDGERDDEFDQLYVCRCGSENCRGTLLAPLPKPSRRATKTRTTKNGKTSKPTKTKAKSTKLAKSGAPPRRPAKTKTKTKTKRR